MIFLIVYVCFVIFFHESKGNDEEDPFKNPDYGLTHIGDIRRGGLLTQLSSVSYLSNCHDERWVFSKSKF